MRILLVSGHFDLCNMGDVAMLQVTVARLTTLWPNSVIEVITARPDLLKMYCPDVGLVHVRGLEEWLKGGNLVGFTGRILPRTVYQRFLKLERHLRDRWPSQLCWLVWLKSQVRGALHIDEMIAFWQAFSRADLVVHSGGGVINDTSKPFETLSDTILDLFAMAIRHGKQTAMFGQGIGPIQHAPLLNKAEAVLPRVGLTAVRESRAAIPLLSSLGVAPSQVIVTGDDAIEPAYSSRPHHLGSGLGVSLRVAPYSGVEGNHIAEIRQVLRAAASKYATSLVPIPICFCPRESDVATLNRILAGVQAESGGTKAVGTPVEIIEQVGRCRIVVAGSYHAGVFALAQGIPVVGLVQSAYYADKFLGLADQFGVGCDVISLADDAFPDKLMMAIELAWKSADLTRPQLLGAAKRQIQLGKAAYERVFDLVTARNGMRRAIRQPGAVASSGHRSIGTL